MGGLRVGLRTRLSSVASFGRVPRAPADFTLHRAMMRGQLYLRRAPWTDGAGTCTDDTLVNYICAGRRPEAPKWVPAGQGRAGGAGWGGGVAVNVFKVHFLDRVLQRLVEQIVDEDVGV